MKIHDVKQGSGEWKALRLGVVTASEIDALVSPEGKIRTGKAVESYVYAKACEKLMGFAPDAGSWAMEQGTILETEARPFYAFTQDAQVTTPGFVTTDNGRLGCSPDGLVGEDGGVEIKCFQPPHSLRVMMENAIPKENILQVQTCLFVTGRKWWDFVSYSRQWPPVIIRVEPDAEIHEAISAAVSSFSERMDAILQKVREVREGENALRGNRGGD